MGNEDSSNRVKVSVGTSGLAIEGPLPHLSPLSRPNIRADQAQAIRTLLTAVKLAMTNGDVEGGLSRMMTLTEKFPTLGQAGPYQLMTHWRATKRDVEDQKLSPVAFVPIRKEVIDE